MGIDERRCQHETGCVHDAMAVRFDVRAELSDHAVVHADVEHGLHPTGRIDDARAPDDEAVLRGVPGGEQRHDATSSWSSAGTAAGPCVRRS